MFVSQSIVTRYQMRDKNDMLGLTDFDINPGPMAVAYVEDDERLLRGTVTAQEFLIRTRVIAALPAATRSPSDKYHRSEVNAIHVGLRLLPAHRTAVAFTLITSQNSDSLLPSSGF